MSHQKNDDMKILVEIAYMYYEEGATQAEIGKKFHMSRSLVSRYLSRARQAGVVDIRINDQLLHPHYSLERQLVKKYGLEDALCIDSYEDRLRLKKSLADRANQYLLRILKPQDIVAVSGGTSINLLSQRIKSSQSYPQVTFVSMTGGLGRDSPDIQANLICRNFAQRLGAQAVSLYAPALVNSPQARKIIMEQKYIKEVFDLAKEADIVLTGVGGYPSTSTLASAYLPELGSHALEQNPEIVGDFCYNFIDDQGHLVDCEWNDRVITLGIGQMQSIPMVIAVAEGQEKIDSLHGALGAGLIDSLVTDEKTAQSLLNFAPK